jgi:hypothetical protein
MSDHAQPYAAHKLAAVIPLSSDLWNDAARDGDLWAAYWRNRGFRERRHTNPFPRINLFTRSARA